MKPSTVERRVVGHLCSVSAMVRWMLTSDAEIENSATLHDVRAGSQCEQV